MLYANLKRKKITLPSQTKFKFKIQIFIMIFNVNLTKIFFFYCIFLGSQNNDFVFLNQYMQYYHL